MPMFANRARVEADDALLDRLAERAAEHQDPEFAWAELIAALAPASGLVVPLSA